MLHTNLGKRINFQTSKPESLFDIIPASEFTFQQLTDIYNETRSDYVVPMPMNQAKLREYVYNYNVDLEQSVVAVSKGEPLGLAMLGVRGHNTWITRMGIVPNGRKKGLGRALMDSLIINSQKLKARVIILEVIKNNKPARCLFNSLGFEELRELLVIRRPPVAISKAIIPNAHIKILGHQDALALLETRTDVASWVTANESLHHVGDLSALVADLPNLGRGWLVYKNNTFQLDRVILEIESDASLKVAAALLQTLHLLHPFQDTSVENLAVDDKTWPVFEALGYMISFARIEMKLDLAALTLNKLKYRMPRSKAIPILL